MKTISFAWTTDALLAGRKTCTCRDWEADYAERFKAGDLIAAYDRSPRFKGKQIATLRLTHDATKATLGELYPEDGGYEAEGFAYYDEQIAAGNTKAVKSLDRNLGIYPGETLRERLDDENRAGWGQWVIRFEVVEFTS